MNTRKMFSRCGICGAEIRERHLGSVKVGDTNVAIDYCERCNTFTVPIGDGEKPYRKRMADAKLLIPKGWSRRQREDGSLELKRGVPCRWLWAFPIGLVAFVASVLAACYFMHIGDMNLQWQVFLAVFAGAGSILVFGFALYRMTARRYRLYWDALVVDSLWLGFIKVCRRRFVRTAITIGIIEERGKEHIAVWSNGYDNRVFWRGRSKEEAEFIEANLIVPCESAAEAEPLLCEKCGMSFQPKDIDMTNNSLVCPRCGAKTEPGNAVWARLVRYRMRYRPQGVVDIPGGFELREERWANATLSAALSRYVAVAVVVAPLAGLFEKRSAPWCYVNIVILLLLLAAVPVYLVASAIVGRFGVHRVTAKGGHLVYFHGMGRFGRREELPLESIDAVGVMYRGSLLDSKATIPNSIGIVVKGEKRGRRIFRDCSPIFYHWAEGWLRNALKT